MQPLVSICVLTYRRPAILPFALASALAQEYRPLEIVVSDDSPDDATTAVVAEITATTDVPIRYTHHVPKLGLAGNHHFVYGDARGKYAVLLHDDDLLKPGAVARLMEPVLRDPRVRATIGRQEYIDEGGALLPRETAEREALIARFDPRHAVEQPIEACLMQYLSNDGFLVETALAQQLGWLSPLGSVMCPDLDFGVRLGMTLAPGEMAFVDAFVSSYRRSPDAISGTVAWRSTDAPEDMAKLYHTIETLDLPARSEYARQDLYRRAINVIVKGLALRGDRLDALRLFASRHYGWKIRLSKRGIYHLALIAWPRIDALRRYGGG